MEQEQQQQQQIYTNNCIHVTRLLQPFCCFRLYYITITIYLLLLFFGESILFEWLILHLFLLFSA